MLTGSHWRLKTQRPSLPVRQPPYDAVCFLLVCNGGIVCGDKAKPPVFNMADGFAVVDPTTAAGSGGAPYSGSPVALL